MQEQKFTFSIQKQGDIFQVILARRLFASGLLAVSITVVLILLELASLLLLNPTHTFVFPFPLLVGFLIFVLEFALIFVGALLIVKPLAIIAYLRATHRAQEPYNQSYIPLTIISNLRGAGSAEQGKTNSPISIQDEHVSVLSLVEQDTHQLIAGMPGAGKTMALHIYHYLTSQKPFAALSASAKIPIYIPMRDYSLFLKQQQSLLAEESTTHQNRSHLGLLSYLVQSDLPDIRYLRGYIAHLFQQGCLLLLCDGVNEIVADHLPQVSEELVRMMRDRDTRNRFVLTCREVDYRRQPELMQLVDNGQVAYAVINPLRTEHIAEYVERYIEKQDKQWKHTAGQVMSVIERSRLRYHCTNSMLLSALMAVIDKIGVERGKQSDTRGRLLREYVRQLITNERKQAIWSQEAPTEQEVIRFLSEIACAARWANEGDAIQLSVPALISNASDKNHSKLSSSDLANALRVWLDEHPARAAFAVEDENRSVASSSTSSTSSTAQLLQFALSTQLIEISSANILRFRHALIAEYFVAEYLFASTSVSMFRNGSTPPVSEQLLEHVELWSEPVALWAGLLDDPMQLAECFGAPGRHNLAYALPALALGLICVGVLWAPPQAEIQRPILLPESIGEAFSLAVQGKETRAGLARIFTLCSQEGGQEIYRSLLPLIMLEGVEEFLTLLDQHIVPALLFTQLQDAINDVAYEAQVKRIARVLGRFGAAVVERAAQLSLPAPERSPRLRAAVINTLGGTNDASAVDPLIARLQDSEPFIVERAINALNRLGPALTLTRLLQELEHRAAAPLSERVHQAVLLILERFMNEQDARRYLSLLQYQSVLDRIVPMLTSNYEAEAEAQQLALEVLIRQGVSLSEISHQDSAHGRWSHLVDALLGYLASQNETAARNVMQVLEKIGPPVVPYLLELLQRPDDNARMRAIEVLTAIRDLRALPALLPLLADRSHQVQQGVAHALLVYAPASIAGLIDFVLHDASDTLADRAAQILVDIGQDVVEPVIAALPGIVPGRTRFLVQILELVRDSRSIDALITLLRTPQLEPLLIISIVRSLGQFPDRRVVVPLLEVLTTTNPQFYEEAITALSQLGDSALGELIAALDVEHDATIAQRVRRAILGMSPFPGERLIQALEHGTQAQVRQILTIFRMRGHEGAAVLVRYLLHPDERLREAIQQTLESMPGAIVVPNLLTILVQPALRKIASTLLLKYPEAAIAPLVDALGEQERGPIAAVLLPQFGTTILRPLIAGLDDQRSTAHEFAQRVLVSLVRQSQEPDGRSVLQEIVSLLADPLPARAREALIGVLTNELASVSLPVLLEGLENVHLIEAVAEALVRLVSRSTYQEQVLNALIAALYSEEQRSGSEFALIRIGTPAVARVGELVVDPDPSVARSAMHILSEIGVPALSFIWTAYSDRNNLPRREAARVIFQRMPPGVIKDELVSLLVSENRDDVAMAVALLLERIHDETRMDYQDQVMVPALIDYIETHNVQETNLRIVALLLLLGEQAITDHLIQALDDNPQHRKQLTYMLLLLGTQTRSLLLEVYADPNISIELRSELAGILSMLGTTNALTESVYKLSEYGLSGMSAGALFSEELALALRALGGLLVSGQWHPRKLMELRDTRASDDPSYELFNILLGWRYTPQIEKLQRDLDAQRDMFKKELLSLTATVAEKQQRVSSLETELEKVRQEHGMRGDELQKISRERETIRINLEQLTNDNNRQRITLEETTRRYNALLAQYHALQKQLQGLSQSPGQDPGRINRPQNTIR
ncbi:MAG: hypothetical protein NVSMB44_30300 [Ktedonobacteraceae bacterium]